MFVIDRLLPTGVLTAYAETAAEAFAEASALIAAGEALKIIGPDGEDLTLQDLEVLADAEGAET